MEHLHSLLSEYDAVVFFDTETTGLDAKENQIIELAAIRVEKWHDGTPYVQSTMDDFIKLPDGELIPERIVELTGITDEMLAESGISAEEAAYKIAHMIRGAVLMVAHNANFDANFLRYLLKSKNVGVVCWLDTLTVYKDRRPYPHKLSDAIAAYGLTDQVQNTHRAIDDVDALIAVTDAMATERDDLLRYVNLFGFNPKYGFPVFPIKNVRYVPQPFHNTITTERTALYAE